VTPTAERIWLDHEHCYRVLSSRDVRFDGRFYAAVRTTGIYCRPSCPAQTPRPGNVEFVPTAAAAQQHGFRACKRCRPDATPGTPDWDVRADLVARAMRLIGDGVVDREGLAGLASRLGYSSRHVTRLLVGELGAGPVALARSQRARAARLLLETTHVPVTDVAFAAGFASVRQFNDTIKAVYATSPTDLRRSAASRGLRPRPPAASGGEAAVTVRLAARLPFAVADVFEFLAARAVPGVEAADAGSYRRTLRLPHGHGVVALEPADDAVRASFRLQDWRDLAPAVERVRRLVDLDADPAAVDHVLGGCAVLGPLVRATPGRRVPGSVDVFETAVRAVVGQQVSVAGARTVVGRIVAAVGERLGVPDDRLTHVFPAPDHILDVADEHLAMPAARRATMRAVAAAVLDGSLALHPGADRDEVRRQLLELRGIGPWTAEYVVMRGLHDPDAFLPSDLGVRRALERAGSHIGAAERWRPWRSYALHHLWASLTVTVTDAGAGPAPRRLS
jgi:AraC family transcriptional regulator, regulatory protein of adaptative response / DNA-3-methyladenine glycosylase II